MKRTSISMAALVVALSVACASTPPPDPVGPDSGGLAVKIETHAPISLWSESIPQVFFVSLETTEDGRLESQEILSSNDTADGYAYLLNVPPGRYVAVACSREQTVTPPTTEVAGGTRGNISYGASVTFGPGTVSYATYFPEDMITLTTTTVEPGRVAFMGEFDVDQSVGLDDADTVQRHYFGIMAPGAQGRGLVANAFRGDNHYTGRLRAHARDGTTQREYMEAARAHFEKTSWLARLE
jgi:hypothetical protein